MAPEIQSLVSFLNDAQSIAVVTGAGVSTASGIPDYRDRDGKWKHAEPIQYGDFVRSERTRKRYWSRSFSGWPRFSKAVPNLVHDTLARLEAAGKVDTLITQNVDELHARAGSGKVIDLHGRLSKVRCLDCDAISERSDFQAALEAANPGWHAAIREIRADGDAEVAITDGHEFSVPACVSCGGNVKPDVVMFGESVPQIRVKKAMAAVDRANAMLVLGTSLMVFSGYRFARRAAETGTPIAIVNLGRTRADELAGLKIEADCLRVLPPAVSAALES